MTESSWQRTELLLGEAVMEKVRQTKVILFGVGGVGSWCAESLIRTGIAELTLVDFDTVATSNLNRQLPATVHTVGKAKVEVLKERLLSINPKAKITALNKRYEADTAEEFALESYDYVLDAIDSVDCKIHLILEATAAGVTLFSSMGAALKIDPTRIRTAEFWKVEGCPLAASLRRKMRKEGLLPSNKFKCVYSNEVYNNTPKGTVAHVTACFGFTLAGLVVQDLAKNQL